MSTPSRGAWLALNFAATIFVSAFLLFQIEPLVSKYILPWFGGTPAVWTTCLLFFQTLLFGGYAYAHFSQMWLKPKQQALVHLALMIAALVFLVVLGAVPGEAWKPTDSLQPVGKILTLLAASVGLPFFVLSSTGPLIQAWFARAYPGRIPYRLYALSNVGSLLALLSYPFFFERIWSVPEQATFWSVGFYLYAALCGCAAIVIGFALHWTESSATDPNVTDLHSANPVAMDVPAQATAASEVSALAADLHNLAAPTLWRRMMWLVLPCFASVALLAITNHVCTDVAVIPFLWVVPLSLYLVTFIIAFDHPRWYRPVLTALFTMLAIYFVAMVFHNGQSEVELYDCGTPGKIAHYVKYHRFTDDDLPEAERPESPSLELGFLTYAGLNFAALLGVCMLCHGELFRLRPHPRYLTGYYLMISAGGALGGVAVTLLAPRFFVTFFEWNLSLFLGFVLASWLILRGILSAFSGRAAGSTARTWSIGHSLGALALALPVLLVTGVGIFDICAYFQPRIEQHEEILLQKRNFFGTLRVDARKTNQPENEIHVLNHGRITHGLQYVSEDRRHIPTTYYAPETGVGRTIGFYRENKNVHGLQIGAVGLGTGTLAAYADQGDSIRFYEINPNVIEITEPGEYFTYLKDCRERGAKCEIELGDARLTLERELKEGHPQKFHVLVLDAFSGDAIPVHLLTQEACQSYVDQIAKDSGDADGAIAVHITNRYVDLEPIVLGLAEHFRLDHVLIINNGGDNQMYRSDWMILSHNRDLIAALSQYGEPPPEERDPKEPKKKPILWTDGKSNLFDVLK
ncbi:MAG TPA: hypothetical protein VFE46_11735 [Pirellulales bacterium]|nr:hypothetical protein [Pirellulales bacterium]